MASPQHRYRIRAVLETQTPLQIADPGAYYVDFNGRFVGKGHGFPCTCVHRMPFPCWPAPASGEHDLDTPRPSASKAELVDVPVIPANTLRGALRRQAANLYYDRLLATGQCLFPKAYNVLQCGAASGHPAGDPPGFDYLLAAGEDAYFGVFGGGPYMLPSKMRLDRGIPPTPLTLDFLDVPGIEAWYCEVEALTSLHAERRCDDLLMLVHADRLPALLQDGREAINAYQDGEMARKAAKRRAETQSSEEAEDREEAARPTRGLMAFRFVETVNSGMAFSLRLDIEGGPQHLGLVLAALDRLITQSGLGGYRRHACGALALPASHISIDDGPYVGLGEQTDEGLRWLEAETPAIAEALAAWQAQAEAISAAQIEAFCGGRPAP